MQLLPKIAVITPGTFAIPDPCSSSVETVVNKTSLLLQNKLNYTIYGKKTKFHPSYEKFENIHYVRFPFFHSRSYIKKVISHLNEVEFDIIQVENRPKYVNIIREGFPNAIIFLSLHSTTFISPSSITKTELVTSFQAANKIIVNSSFLRNLIIKKTNCNPNKVFVNHLGVNLEQFQSKWLPDQQKEIKQFKADQNLQDQNILLYVGRLRKIKGVHHVLKALPKIIKLHPNTILLIVGSAYYGTNKRTRYVDTLMDLANEVKGHVQFIPFIPHNEIHKWFQIADLMLVPSDSKEAFGLVNVEAMATGTPVIATRCGGIPEIIKHGKTGYLIDKKRIQQELPSAIIEILSQPSMLKKLGETSVNHVQEYFTWQHSANRLLELYKRYCPKRC